VPTTTGFVVAQPMIPLCRLASCMLADPILCQSGRWSTCTVRENGGADKTVVGDEVQVRERRNEIGSRAQIRGMKFEMADRRIFRWFTAKCEAMAMGTLLRCPSGWLLVWRAPTCSVVVTIVALDASRTGNWWRSLQEIKCTSVKSGRRKRWQDRG
jgi:hypothetical protein